MQSKVFKYILKTVAVTLLVSLVSSTAWAQVWVARHLLEHTAGGWGSKKKGFGGDLDKLTWKILGGVKKWPSYDLF